MIKEQILQLENSRPKVFALLQVIFGSLFIATLAQIAIPIKPIPMTLQTLGVFLLPMFMEKRKAACALLLYLAEAAAGLPVLAGMKMNPLWIIGPTSGYLIGFPVAAYLIGWMLEKREGQSFAWTALSLLLGQAVIYASGVFILSLMIGWKTAFYAGFLPFLPLGLYKVGLALAIRHGYLRFKPT